MWRQENLLQGNGAIRFLQGELAYAVGYWCLASLDKRPAFGSHHFDKWLPKREWQLQTSQWRLLMTCGRTCSSAGGRIRDGIDLRQPGRRPGVTGDNGQGA